MRLPPLGAVVPGLGGVPPFGYMGAPLDGRLLFHTAGGGLPPPPALLGGGALRAAVGGGHDARWDAGERRKARGVWREMKGGGGVKRRGRMKGAMFLEG